MKKFLPYILILVVLVGLFSFTPVASAVYGTCWSEGKVIGKSPNMTPAECASTGSLLSPHKKGVWQDNGTPVPPPPDGPSSEQAPYNKGTCWANGVVVGVYPSITIKECTDQKGIYQKEGDPLPDPPAGPAKDVVIDQSGATVQNASGGALEDNLSCSPANIPGCIVYIFYVLFYMLPAFLLGIAANFFNVIMSLTISSALYTKSHFIPDAWRVVRDLSNIFFILVLLYIAIKVVLGMTGHGVKQTISQVVIMAILINFSMFFTSVVIDASNILALVFYNKIKVEAIPAGGNQSSHVDYVAMLNPKATGGIQDKDLAGALVSNFNPSYLLTQDFFELIKTEPVGSVTGLATYAAGGAIVGSFIPVVGTLAGGVIGTVAYGIKLAFGGGLQVPPGLMIGIITVSGSIMAFAAYALFMAAISFLSRMIELWILIIASPFAFMSSTLPGLDGIEFVGWKSWTKHLVQTSFMAPIFMFMLYLIFLIVQNDIFKNLSDGDAKTRGVLQNIIFLLIPAMVILVLLNRATSYAKKSSGAAGELVMGGIKAAGLLAAGGAVVGAATIGRGVIGGVAKNIQNDDARKKAYQFKDTRAAWTSRSWYNPMKYVAPVFRSVGDTNKLLTAIPASVLQAKKTVTVGTKTITIGGIGQRMQAAEKSIEKRESSIHSLDDKAGELSHKFGYSEKQKYKDLKESQQKEVREAIDLDLLAKTAFGQSFDKISDDSRNAVRGANIVRNASGNIESFDLAKDKTRPTVRETYTTNTAMAGTPGVTVVKNLDGGDAKAKYADASAAMGEFVRALRTGSYDLRNLSEAQSKVPGFNKFAVGLLAITAGVMRAGLKKTGVDIGKSNKDFLKDMGDVVVNSLKNVKIDAKDVVKAVTDHAGGHEGGHGGGHH